MGFDEYYRKNYQLLYKYLIKLDDYEDLLDFQGGLCPICDESFEDPCENSLVPCLDHDHSTGEVRGILHLRCNLLLGYAQDNVKILENSIKYLQGPPARYLFSADLIDFD